MSNKFPYGYDVNKYIDKAIEKMKATYPWVSKDIFNNKNEFKIEKIGNRYEYIYIYHWDDEDSKEILKCDSEGFIDTIINRQEYTVQNYNEVKEQFEVPGQEGKQTGGWYLERYTFRSHVLGGYSVFCQAGDRVAGGSRTFFIPNSYFEGDYNSFLDKYIKLVPPSFGFTKEELKEAHGLKEFLGFK